MLIDASLSNYQVPLEISSLSKTLGSIQGGQYLQINGKGFPISNLEGLSVKFGGIQAEIFSTSNIALKIKTPAGKSNGLTQIEIDYKGLKTSYNAYQYSDIMIPKITKISPNSAAPTLKTIVTIEGENFNTDKTKLKAFLSSSNNASLNYELSIINSTNNLIYAVLGGGKRGSYQLKVSLEEVGSSQEVILNAALFKYELLILDITPNTGSVYGGTKITISGKNFSPVNKQNQIYIGENNYCIVIESSSNSIICETKPAPSSEYLNTPLDIIMTQRIQEEAICKAKNCQFTFVNTTSPIINTDNLLFIVARAGESVSLTGNNLYPDLNSKAFVKFIKGTRIDESFFFDMDLQIEAFEVNTNYIKFKMPALIQGSYTIQVYIGNNGWAFIDPSFTIVTPIEVYSITINEGLLDNDKTIGSRGGLLLNITGNGFYDEIIYIDNNVWWCPIVSNTTTTIICSTLTIWNDNIFKVYVYRDSKNRYTCSNCTFNVSGIKTAYITDSNCTTTIGLNSNFTCLLTGRALNLSLNPIPYIDEYSPDNKYLRQRIKGNTLNITQKNLLISFKNVPNNTYKLSIYYPPQGYAIINQRSLTVGLFDIRSISVESSYLGGKNLSIFGGIFPDMTRRDINNVSICGSVCKIMNSGLNEINCRVPKLINPIIMDNYKIRDQESCFNKEFDVYADDSWRKKYINDEKLSTYYHSENSLCYIIFDFGKDYLFEAQEIHYYPSVIRIISDYYDLLFQGSFDGLSWDNLFVLNRNIKTGWNIWSGKSPSYRFYKLQSPIENHKSHCNIAEVKFYGIKYYNNANTLEVNCEVNLNINGYSLILPSLVHYNQNNTPTVNEVSPNIGPTSGGSAILILGNGFGYTIGNVSVFVDGINCLVRSVNNEKIICVTGEKSYFSEGLLEVYVNGNKAIVKGGNFSYIDRWSESKTWGGETPPRE